jgi:hypothetical protein
MKMCVGFLIFAMSLVGCGDDDTVIDAVDSGTTSSSTSSTSGSGGDSNKWGDVHPPIVKIPRPHIHF